MFNRHIVPSVVALALGWAISSHVVQAAESAPKSGDTVVTLADAPLQRGAETLANLPAGTELVVDVVQGEWLGVTVQRDGNAVKGWLDGRHVAQHAETYLGGLIRKRLDAIWYSRLRLDPVPTAVIDMDGFQTRTRGWALNEDAAAVFRLIDENSDGNISYLEFIGQSPTAMFRAIDVNQDDSVSLPEFFAATTNPTLADLNRDVARVLASPEGKPLHGRTSLPRMGDGAMWLRLGPEASNAYLELMGRFFNFDGWKAGTRITESQAHELLAFYLRTRDVQQSPFARELVGGQNTSSTVQAARALFRWTDKNGDAKLTLAEFTRVCPENHQEKQ